VTAMGGNVTSVTGMATVMTHGRVTRGLAATLTAIVTGTAGGAAADGLRGPPGVPLVGGPGGVGALLHQSGAHPLATGGGQVQAWGQGCGGLAHRAGACRRRGGTGRLAVAAGGVESGLGAGRQGAWRLVAPGGALGSWRVGRAAAGGALSTPLLV
jgi:hypothetical protein